MWDLNYTITYECNDFYTIRLFDAECAEFKTVRFHLGIGSNGWISYWMNDTLPISRLVLEKNFRKILEVRSFEEIFKELKRKTVLFAISTHDTYQDLSVFETLFNLSTDVKFPNIKNVNEYLQFHTVRNKGSVADYERYYLHYDLVEKRFIKVGERLKPYQRG